MNLAKNNLKFHGKRFKNSYINKLYKAQQKRDMRYARISSFVFGFILGALSVILALVVA